MKYSCTFAVRLVEVNSTKFYLKEYKAVVCEDSCLSFLLQDKPNLPAIIFRSNCKVQPIDGASSFKEQFIKLLLFLVGNVQQYYHIAEGLLHPCTADINGTASHVVASFAGVQPCPLHRQHDLVRPEALIDD